jgi:hypothetical protein
VGSLVQNKGFITYDNACVPRGVYSWGDDCGSPYVIQENWLPYVLTVTNVNFNIADGYFRFVYANGAYMIGENQAMCEDLVGGLRVEVGCKTGFPIYGEP